jgi:hypothetical protein
MSFEDAVVELDNLLGQLGNPGIESEQVRARNIRVGDYLWNTAINQAREEGTSLSELIREWLTSYVNKDKPRMPAKVRLSPLELSAVRDAVGGLGIPELVVDAINEQRKK